MPKDIELPDWEQREDAQEKQIDEYGIDQQKEEEMLLRQETQDNLAALSTEMTASDLPESNEFLTDEKGTFWFEQLPVQDYEYDV